MEVILPPLNEEDRFIAGLEYIFWFAVSIWVLFSYKRKEPFLFFHAWQSLFLGLFLVAVNILVFLFLLIFLKIFNLLPGTASSVMIIVLIFALVMFFLAEFAVIIYYAYKSSEGENFRLPYISVWAEKFYKKRFGY